TACGTLPHQAKALRQALFGVFEFSAGHFELSEAEPGPEGGLAGIFNAFEVRRLRLGKSAQLLIRFGEFELPGAAGFGRGFLRQVLCKQTGGALILASLPVRERRAVTQSEPVGKRGRSRADGSKSGGRSPKV